MPRISGISGRPLVGDSWNDPRVIGGAKLALALAELPYALGTVFLGAGFLQRQYLLMLGLGLGGLFLTAWAFRYLRRKLSEQKAEHTRRSHNAPARRPCGRVESGEASP